MLVVAAGCLRASLKERCGDGKAVGCGGVVQGGSAMIICYCEISDGTHHEEDRCDLLVVKDGSVVESCTSHAVLGRRGSAHGEFFVYMLNPTCHYRCEQVSVMHNGGGRSQRLQVPFFTLSNLWECVSLARIWRNTRTICWSRALLAVFATLLQHRAFEHLFPVQCLAKVRTP